MSVIVERPIRQHVALEAFVTEQNPFILDTSWLGAAGPGAPWGIELGDGASTIVWNEYTDNLLSVTIARGGTRDGITINNSPGMLTVALRDFEIDPFNPSFVVDQPVRFTAIIDGTPHRLFTGRVRDIETNWIKVTGRRTLVPVTTIVAVDAVSDLDATTRYGAMPPSGSETFRERIARLSQSTAVPIVLPNEGDYLDYLGQPYQLGRTVYESSVSNHLTLACNSVGAMWWLDPAGAVRFQPRRWDADNAILMASQRDDDYPSGTLQMLTPVTDAGTNSQINAALIRVKGAAPDPENPSNWLATEVDHHSQDWERPNRIPTILEVNNLGVTYEPNVHGWLEPYRGRWTNILSGVRWNAQQNLSRLPDLEIGASIRDEHGGTYTGRWPNYLVIGIQHTITATRWLVDLTLIGAYE